jgi:hypothetical protein
MIKPVPGASQTGTHLERIPMSKPARALRRGINVATVAGLRVRPVAQPSDERRAKYPKIFVIGCGRSGTTWVQDVIAAHPSVLTSQESHAYEVVYGNVERFGSRSLKPWVQVLQRFDISKGEQRWVGLHWWIDRPHLVQLVHTAIHNREQSSLDVAENVIEGIFDHFFFQASGGTAANTLMEKGSHYRFAERFMRRFTEAKVVEVVRDGRDVCVSMEMQALTARWPPRSRAEQIQLWTSAVEAGMRLRANPDFTDRIYRIRYEDLKSDPFSEISRLYEYCDFDASEAVIRDVVDRTDFRHHRNTGDGQHNRRGVVGDWSNHFSAEDAALFRRLAGELFEASGYSF